MEALLEVIYQNSYYSWINAFHLWKKLCIRQIIAKQLFFCALFLNDRLLGRRGQGNNKEREYHKLQQLNSISAIYALLRRHIGKRRNIDGESAAAAIRRASAALRRTTERCRDFLLRLSREVRGTLSSDCGRLLVALSLNITALRGWRCSAHCGRAVLHQLEPWLRTVAATTPCGSC